jgi:hypothetical protein
MAVDRGPEDSAVRRQLHMEARAIGAAAPEAIMATLDGERPSAASAERMSCPPHATVGRAAPERDFCAEVPGMLANTPAESASANRAMSRTVAGCAGNRLMAGV